MSSALVGSGLVVLDEQVQLRDGTRLATDVCVGGHAGPRPALLIRTPYSRQTARNTYDLVGLARDGWAVVVQDVRGRFGSGGTFDGFAQERDDGEDSVAWCAAQRWCDGRVVMTGVSYLGAAQWAAASRAPAPLVALNPLLAPADPPETALWQCGAFQLALAQSWMLGMLASDTEDSPQRRSAQQWAERWRDAQRATAADDPVRALSRSYDRWRRGPRAAEPWLPVSVPAFQVAGWYDVFCESALTAHVRQSDSGLPGVTVIGPWAHNERLTNLTPEWDFGPLGNGELADLRGEGLRWLRARLSGEETDHGVRFFVMGAHVWRSAPSWPPPARPTSWFLGVGTRSPAAPDGDGLLLTTPPTTPGSVSWRHDPDDPVPSWGGRVLGPMLPLPGPADQRQVESRGDVLVFTSPVLTEKLEIVGPVRAQLRVSSSAPTFDITVKLCDVHADERSFNIVDGITRVTGAGEAATLVDIAVGTTAHAFLPGHRVRIEIAGSNFPRFDLNPCRGDGESTYAPARLHLHWGSRSGSTLLLPVFAGQS